MDFDMRPIGKMNMLESFRTAGIIVAALAVTGVLL